MTYRITRVDPKCWIIESRKYFWKEYEYVDAGILFTEVEDTIKWLRENVRYFFINLVIIFPK
jgi:hypothetical protein